MNIIYLHQYFNTPLMNGGTRSYEMARRMVKKGHEVHMVTSRREASVDLNSSNDWSYEVIEGIHVHWLIVPYNNKMSYVDRIKAFVKFALKSGTKAIEIGGDVIFATSTPLTIAIPAVKAKRKLKVPMVFEVRDLWPELPIAIGALKSPVTKWLAKKLELFAYKNADHVVCLSPGMQEGVVKTGYSLDNTSIIPNSCDLDLFDPSKHDGKAFRAQRPWLQDRPLVLYAGTLGHINGVDWLARLAHEMLQINSEVRFLVVGEGVDLYKIRAQAAKLGVLDKNFFMEAAIAKEEVPDVLAAATVATSLFIPLKEMWANSANKFFDALAAGKPVAINYGGWQADLIEKNDVGLVLDNQDLNGSATELNTLLQNSSLLESRGKNARALAEKELSRDVLAAQLIDVIEREASK